MSKRLHKTALRIREIVELKFNISVSITVECWQKKKVKSEWVAYGKKEQTISERVQHRGKMSEAR